MPDQSIMDGTTEQVRCWRCAARVADIFAFYGRFSVDCRKCRGITVWTGASVDLPQSQRITKRNDRHRMQLPSVYTCPECHRYPISAPAFRGRIDRQCNACQKIFSIQRNDPEAVISEWMARSPHIRRTHTYGDAAVLATHARLTRPTTEEMLLAMEERWTLFSKEKLRERGRVAVGLRFDVFNRDGFQCRYCGRSIDDGIILHADHVIPESKGGPTTLQNLVTACSDCNLGKSAKDLVV